MLMYLFGFIGSIIVIMLLAWFQDWLGISRDIIGDIIVEPLKNFSNTVFSGLASPFKGLAKFFENILPEAMKPYAFILAVTLIITMVMGVIYIVYRLMRTS